MVATISPESLEAFPEVLIAVGRSGRIRIANSFAGQLLQLPAGGPPEVTLREMTELSLSEIDNLLHLCLSTTTPVPLRLTLYPAGVAPLLMRGEGWRCEFAAEPAAMIRLFADSDAKSSFSDLTQLLDELNHECMVRRLMEDRLRSALAELHDLNSVRGLVLSQVSHDLRTPLNAIIGMTEFMRTRPFGPLAPKYIEYIEDIHASGESLLLLVDQVLQLSEDESGREVTVEALVDLSECLESCRKVVEPLARVRELEIMIPADIALPKLRADQLLVKQILMQLMGNAAKYTREGGQIQVSVNWRKGEALVIEVRDDGPGIAKEELVSINGGHIARSVYTTGDRQIGYGLAFSQRSARAMGGRLDIRSSPTGGTVAALVLPAELIASDFVL